MRVVALGAAVVVVVGVLLAVSLHFGSSSRGTPPDVSVRGVAIPEHEAPMFTARDLDGKKVSLASYLGRPVVLSFGASWCEPCNKEYPLLVKAAAKHPHDLAMLSVMHMDLTPDAKRFVAEYHADWPAINDESNAISDGVRRARHSADLLHHEARRDPEPGLRRSRPAAPSTSR